MEVKLDKEFRKLMRQAAEFHASEHRCLSLIGPSKVLQLLDYIDELEAKLEEPKFKLFKEKKK